MQTNYLQWNQAGSEKGQRGQSRDDHGFQSLLPCLCEREVLCKSRREPEDGRWKTEDGSGTRQRNIATEPGSGTRKRNTDHGGGNEADAEHLLGNGSKQINCPEDTRSTLKGRSGNGNGNESSAICRRSAWLIKHTSFSCSATSKNGNMMVIFVIVCTIIFAIFPEGSLQLPKVMIYKGHGLRTMMVPIPWSSYYFYKIKRISNK